MNIENRMRRRWLPVLVVLIGVAPMSATYAASLAQELCAGQFDCPAFQADMRTEAVKAGCGKYGLFIGSGAGYRELAPFGYVEDHGHGPCITAQGFAQGLRGSGASVPQPGATPPNNACAQCVNSGAADCHAQCTGAP
jgi:hypothetical protein